MKIGRAVVHPLRLPLPRPLKTVEASGPVLAAAPHAMLLEHMDWWQELFDERLPIVEGAVVLPERPGIGLGLDRAALARFRA
jgi:L-alanine-DL-glutamate epimerase-like enolase superfamily enzyme